MCMSNFWRVSKSFHLFGALWYVFIITAAYFLLKYCCFSSMVNKDFCCVARMLSLMFLHMLYTVAWPIATALVCSWE